MNSTDPTPSATPSPVPSAYPVYIVMGVTGSGKTTIGELLASRLEIPFHDADDFHPQSNLDKLAHDIPLDDKDREPWLENLARHIAQWASSGGAVLACSALKHSYRSQFRRAAASVHFVFLTGDPNIIAHRLEKRAREGNHVVKDFHHILKCQYKDLEIPTSALQVDVQESPDDIVDSIITQIHNKHISLPEVKK